MPVALYAHRLSQPSRAVEILLRELDLPYEWHEVDFANGETRASWFTQRINALQTIPAIVVPAAERDSGKTDFTLCESHAILRYLCRHAQSESESEATVWYPGAVDAERAAVIDLWMAWHHNHVRRYDMFHAIMNLHLTLPMLKYELQSDALVPLQNALHLSLATLESQLTTQNDSDANTPTLCGGAQPTLADLTIACELYQAVAVGYRFDRYPRVAHWLDTMAARPHFRQVSTEVDEQGRTIRESSGDYLDFDAFA
ncbi:glutathione S-transferase family protein [Marinobacter fonticola]|uniref:glutathione S-transferase family protein n=1 Tax=Marinobacter fonticola TaxID=2603215 RepID=UPI0011E6AED8|nr:glutathione S-transferase family protein [Marinobacter fonticola]